MRNDNESAIGDAVHAADAAHANTVICASSTIATRPPHDELLLATTRHGETAVHAAVAVHANGDAATATATTSGTAAAADEIHTPAAALAASVHTTAQPPAGSAACLAAAAGQAASASGGPAVHTTERSEHAESAARPVAVGDRGQGGRLQDLVHAGRVASHEDTGCRKGMLCRIAYCIIYLLSLNSDLFPARNDSI